MEMGSESGCSAMLRWAEGGGDHLAQQFGPTKPIIKATPKDVPVDWNAFIINPFVR